MERLKSDSVGGGNIVVAEAFFRTLARYRQEDPEDFVARFPAITEAEVTNAEPR